MKKIKIVIFACIIILLWGCGNSDKSDKDGIRIGVVYYDGSDTFIGELMENFKGQIANRLENEKIYVSFRDAEGSQRTQNSQVDELIMEGCDVLLVNLVDRANPSQVIDVASKNDVPIIFYNREPVEEDLKQWDKLYYIGADAEQSGTLQGEEASEYIISHPEVDKNQDGKIQYVILEGEPGHQDAIIRTEAVIATLARQGIELEKISHAISNWSRPQAKNRMTQLIKEYGDAIELVLGNNDDMAIGAYEAYESAGIDRDDMPRFFGIDGTAVGLTAVKDGILSATVYNDKEGQGRIMAELAIIIAKNQGLESIEFTEDKTIYLPYFKVDGSNIDDYIN